MKNRIELIQERRIFLKIHFSKTMAPEIEGYVKYIIQRLENGPATYTKNVNI